MILCFSVSILEHFVDFPGVDDGRSIYGRYSYIIKSAGVFAEVQPYDYCIFCDPLPRQWFTEPYILICIDASTSKRCWEMEKFAELAELLRRKYARKIILCGVDHERGEKIIALSRCPENIVNLCGQTTIFQLFFPDGTCVISCFQ